ncbi:hypothetical protein CBFG_02286 [Clostridiales bacterium 1_7_47FAA]|nr:hypothetical protein CBFG_02286 [Clostridiales bacterium 1_7_47FAA]
MLPADYLNVLTDTAHPVVQTGRAFYLLIFHHTNPMPIPFHPYQLIPFHSCLMNT